MKNKKIYLMATLCVISLLWMTAVLLWQTKKDVGFSPPPFEISAQQGTPVPCDESYTEISQEGMEFSAHLCGKVSVKNKQAFVLFTNDSTNQIWMKLRILDEEGNILGESGLLKPNEYVETVALTKAVKPGCKVKLKIMAYEPETYYSAGSVILNTTLSEGGN